MFEGVPPNMSVSTSTPWPWSAFESACAIAPRISSTDLRRLDRDRQESGRARERSGAAPGGTPRPGGSASRSRLRPSCAPLHVPVLDVDLPTGGAQLAGERLRDRHRAVSSARAADRRSSGRPCPPHRRGEAGTRAGRGAAAEEPTPRGVSSTYSADLGVPARERPQAVFEVGIGQEAHVEEQLRGRGRSVAEAEGDEVHHGRRAPPPRRTARPRP